MEWTLEPVTFIRWKPKNYKLIITFPVLPPPPPLSNSCRENLAQVGFEPTTPVLYHLDQREGLMHMVCCIILKNLYIIIINT